jgi:hypothetical protein
MNWLQARHIVHNAANTPDTMNLWSANVASTNQPDPTFTDRMREIQKTAEKASERWEDLCKFACGPWAAIAIDPKGEQFVALLQRLVAQWTNVKREYPDEFHEPDYWHTTHKGRLVRSWEAPAPPEADPVERIAYTHWLTKMDEFLDTKDTP